MKKFKNIFQSVQLTAQNIGWQFNVIEKVNSVIIYNNGGGFLVINTGITVTPILSAGMKFEIKGNANEVLKSNDIKLFPFFGFPNVTIITKVLE